MTLCQLESIQQLFLHYHNTINSLLGKSSKSTLKSRMFVMVLPLYFHESYICHGTPFTYLMVGPAGESGPFLSCSAHSWQQKAGPEPGLASL